MALAPLPTTATRFAGRSTPSGHCAEWNTVPPKSSRPGIEGILGRFSCPTALTTMSATIRSPVDRSSVHSCRSSAHVAASTSVENRISGRSRWASAKSRR